MNKRTICTPGKFLTFLIFVLILASIAAPDSRAQFKDRLYISTGVTTAEIMGNNLGGKPILERDTSAENFGKVGGGFTGPQPGISLLFTMMLDSEERFRVPVGIDHYFYQSAQRVPYTANYTLYLRHSMSVSTLRLGFDWAFAHITMAEASFYTGIDLNATFLSGDEYSVEWEHSFLDSLSTRSTSSKDNAVRFGAGLKFGIHGHIYENWYVNIFWNWSIINLLGREEETGEPLERGELFTPKTANNKEYEENYVHQFNFNFQLQYRL